MSDFIVFWMRNNILPLGDLEPKSVLRGLMVNRRDRLKNQREKKADRKKARRT